MIRCKACKEEKNITEFRVRPDLRSGHANVCKKCTASKNSVGKYINELGNIYGSWVVIDRAENKTDGSAQWLCKCSCGTTRVISANTLRTGNSLSCGCLRAALGKEKRQENTLVKKVLRSYKAGAKYRNHEFTLTDEEVTVLLFSKCSYCGEEPSNKVFYNNNGKKDLTDYITINGIDRIDNSKGYNTNNVVSCCKMCNGMKSDYTYEKFIKKIKQIKEYLDEKNGIDSEGNCATRDT